LPAPTTAKAKALLRQVAKAPVALYPAVGLGEDLRFQSKTLSGGALSADGVLLHLCAFRQAQASSRPADDGGTIHRRTGGRNHIIE
jgi:hypothetical protein